MKSILKISTKKLILGVLLVSSILGVVFWSFGTSFWKGQSEEGVVELTVWNIGEEERVYRPIIEAYQAAHPNIKINYVKQSWINYRPRLQTQLKAGQGPDIFLIHNSWLGMFLPDLAASPEGVLTISELTQNYYPLARDTLTSQGKVYALPAEMNGLVMYYNEDILKAAGINPPRDWQEFLAASRRVTVKNSSGQIQTSGAAMGATGNVDFWPEIITMLFMQQPEGDLSNPASSDGAEVLKFYTNFITDPKNKTWDTTLPSSTQMFISGKLAFYFAPLSKAAEIKATAPNLNFKTGLLPQLPGKTVGVGSFYAWAVSTRSSHQDKAWEFVRFLSLPEVLQAITPPDRLTKFYPRVEMGRGLAQDPIFNSFLIQAPYYKSWYLNSGVLDGGINEEMVKVYEGAIGAVLGGGDPFSALSSITPQIKEVLNKYQTETVR